MALGGALGLAWAPVTPRHFAWQAWHKLTSTVVSRGRRGTNSHSPSFCVAGVGHMALGGALGLAWAPVTPRHFAWQAWHKLTSTVVSRGRRGTNSHPPSFCVAGVGHMALGGALGLAWAPVTPRHFAWQAWHKLTSTVVSRGRRGTNSHPPSFCVAGVAQMALGGALGLAWAPVTPRHFAWQAWHKLTSTYVSRGRRGTNSHPPSFCVAGVGHMALGGALGLAWAPVTPRHFAWQAWHKLTSTVVSRGRRGTNSHSPSFCVAGVGQIISHTPSQTIFHTLSLTHRLCHTPSFTHNFVTHQLCHTPSFTHQLCHTPSFIHLFVTPHLSYTIFHTSHCHAPSFTHHLSHTTLSHTIFDTPLCHTPLCHTSHCHTPSFTHHIVTHHLSHTTLSHTIFATPLCHTPLCHTSHCHTPSFTHHIVTHHLSHTTLSHTIFATPLCHTPLCHTPSFTHHLPHTTLSHAIFHTPSQTIFSHHLSHTIFHTTLCLAPSFTTPSFTHHFVTHHLSPHHLSHTTLSHTIFHTPSSTHHFVTHHLSHTTLSHALFHTQLSHTPSCTHHFVIHTIFLSHTPAFTYNFVTHNFVLLLGPPPPPLSFLPSPSPLQHLVLFIQRSCLVGLSGPLIY